MKTKISQNIREASNIKETLTASLQSLEHYKRFLNWLSADFELYLQDDDTGLTIYFPGGFIKIKQKGHEQTGAVNIVITISSKHKKSFDTNKTSVLQVLNHFKLFYQ